MLTTKPLIAVVDDDRSVVKSLARLLRSTGYEVSTFGSAQEFLSSLPASLPECLVLDVQMPEMTGIELQSRLRELGHRVPVVFMTAHDTPQTRAAATRDGILGLIFKPFAPAAFLATVGKAAVPSPIRLCVGEAPGNPLPAQPQVPTRAADSSPQPPASLGTFGCGRPDGNSAS